MGGGGGPGGGPENGCFPGLGFLEILRGLGGWEGGISDLEEEPQKSEKTGSEKWRKRVFFEVPVGFGWGVGV